MSDHGSAVLNSRARPTSFAQAEAAPFDLVVIGAGITGAGIAHDAARRGLRVALVESHDIASGTSSRSSKMIHGGLRYLAQGDVSLVREAARERQTLRRTAPHLARYAEFTMPCSATILATMRAGLVAFERLGRVPKHERHRVLKADELLEREPALRGDRYAGGVRYAEFLTNDARLTLANVRSAVRSGATVLTHAPVSEIIVVNGRAAGVVCRSTIEGEDLAARIRARAVVNAAGPWVDAIRRLEHADAPSRLTLTKGIHVVVPTARLGLRGTVLTLGRDHRPLFAVPVGAVTYLGTTDTLHPDARVWPSIERADVEYLFDAFADTLSGPRLAPSDVVAMWAGVRPLVSDKGKAPSEISRKDEMWVGPAGVRSIGGGKLTAYRTMAARVVDAVVDDLGLRLPACSTDEATLVGGDLDLETSVAALAPALGAAAARRLVELYGSEAATVPAEVRQGVTREGALRLEDLWVRRSGRAWFGLDPVGHDLEVAAHEMARLLGWDPARRTAEVQACHQIHHAALSCLDPDHDPDPGELT